MGWMVNNLSNYQANISEVSYSSGALKVALFDVSLWVFIC